MYKLLILLFIFPLFVSAYFSRDLYYGVKNDPQVTELQQFLKDRNVYSGPVTGNFFSLTRQAVKNFQIREGIISTGYFGPLSRTRANIILSEKSSKLNEVKIQSKPIIQSPIIMPTFPPIIPTPDTSPTPYSVIYPPFVYVPPKPTTLYDVEVSGGKSFSPTKDNRIIGIFSLSGSLDLGFDEMRIVDIEYETNINEATSSYFILYTADGQRPLFKLGKSLTELNPYSFYSRKDFYITLDENFEGTKTYEDSGIYYLTFKKIKLSSPSGNIHYVSGQPFGFTFVVR